MILQVVPIKVLVNLVSKFQLTINCLLNTKVLGPIFHAIDEHLILIKGIGMKRKERKLVLEIDVYTTILHPPKKIKVKMQIKQLFIIQRLDIVN